MVSIQGLLSHRKLMELKNSGVIEAVKFEELADEMYEKYIGDVARNIRDLNKGIFKYLGGYSDRKAKLEARLMFSNRSELLSHMIYLSGESKFLRLTNDELNDFTLLHQAALGAQRAEAVLRCFKYSDQVLVDEDTGFHVDWMLKNAYLLRQYLTTEGESND